MLTRRQARRLSAKVTLGEVGCPGAAVCSSWIGVGGGGGGAAGGGGGGCVRHGLVWGGGGPGGGRVLFLVWGVPPPPPPKHLISFILTGFPRPL